MYIKHYTSINLPANAQPLTLTLLHVSVPTSFIKFNEALTKLMKLLPNHIMV